MKQDDNFVSNV